MADTALLGDLCVICHSPPKYRCPRCSARTCSLVCSKRHKQWAQCSGTKDPAAYLKRSELATPKSFDQDFNFISGIERTIERADRDATSRGVQLRGVRPVGRRDGPAKGEVHLQKAIEKCGVMIEKAPVGMSRSTNNKTSWNKNQRCISWTVEWVLDDGRRELGTCLENDTLSVAFRKHFEPSVPHSKRRKTRPEKGDDDGVTAPGETPKGIISLNRDPCPPASALLGPHSLPPALEDTKLETIKLPTNTSDAQLDSVNEELVKQESKELRTTVSAHTSTDSPELEAAQLEIAEPGPAERGTVNLSVTIPDSTLDYSSEQPTHIHAGTGHVDRPISPFDPPAPARHFYLHLPHPAVPSSKPTLLPLSPLLTLSTALRTRIVREYPTIYALNQQAGHSTSARFSVQREGDAELEAEIKGMLDCRSGGSEGERGSDSKGKGDVEDLNGRRKEGKPEIRAGDTPSTRELDDWRYIQESFV